MDATLDALHLAHFSWTDVLRRAQGDAFEALGLGPHECPHRMVASGSHWRLRDYTDHKSEGPRYFQALLPSSSARLRDFGARGVAPRAILGCRPRLQRAKSRIPLRESRIRKESLPLLELAIERDDIPEFFVQPLTGGFWILIVSK